MLSPQTFWIPPEYQPEMLRLRLDGRAVMRFARKVGVSPGIVVGQLQHHNRFRRNQLKNPEAAIHLGSRIDQPLSTAEPSEVVVLFCQLQSESSSTCIPTDSLRLQLDQPSVELPGRDTLRRRTPEEEEAGSIERAGRSDHRGGVRLDRSEAEFPDHRKVVELHRPAEGDDSRHRAVERGEGLPPVTTGRRQCIPEQLIVGPGWIDPGNIALHRRTRPVRLVVLQAQRVPAVSRSGGCTPSDFNVFWLAVKRVR